MSVLELEKLLAPVSPDAPSGEDMEYDPAFQVMRRAAEGQPERHMGSSVVPAEEPDWQLAGSLAAELLMRTKDLRIAVTLTRARLHTEGFVGMRDGLALTRRLLIELWDSVHPQLDPEEDNDPTERVNALLDLCGRETLLNPVRTTPLVNSRVFGPVTLRDIEIAEGKIAPPPETDAPSLDMAAINGAFLDCELGGLRQTATDITASLADLKGIETAVTERVGASQAPDLAPLSGLLTEGAALLHSRLAERAGEEAETAEVGVEATSPEAGAGPSTTAPQRITGEITSREDVVRTLDKLCDYYSRNEPSSPVPLLLQRARRLAKKDFMDIMRDLAPDALAQIEAIRGPNGDQ